LFNRREAVHPHQLPTFESAVAARTLAEPSSSTASSVELLPPKILSSYYRFQKSPLFNVSLYTLWIIKLTILPFYYYYTIHIIWRLDLSNYMKLPIS